MSWVSELRGIAVEQAVDAGRVDGGRREDAGGQGAEGAADAVDAEDVERVVDPRPQAELRRAVADDADAEADEDRRGRRHEAGRRRDRHQPGDRADRGAEHRRRARDAAS